MASVYIEGIPVGSTSVSMPCVLRDKTTLLPITGKVAADLTVSYWIQGAAPVDITSSLTNLAAITTAFTAYGIHEASTSLQPGAYRIDWPDATWATAAKWVMLCVQLAATGDVVFHEKIPLTANVVQSGDTFALVGSPAGGTLAVALAEIEAETDDIAAVKAKTDNLPTAPASTTNITGGTITTVTTLTNAPSDSSGTTTLLGRLTSARAGYFDNLNVGGAVASHADILAINQSASKHLLLVTVGQYEPGETYTIEMRTFTAADGSAVNADTTPTLTATGNVSGSLSSNLSAATNPATGVYRWTYTPGATPTLEQIRFDGSATISSATFTLSCYSQTVDEATAVFTATDQSHLTSIFNKLPTNNIADETVLLAAIGTPQQAAVAVTLPVHAPSTFLDLVLVDGKTLPASLQIIAAIVAGKLTGSETNTEIYLGLDGVTTRVTATTDGSGNRSVMAYN